MSFIERVIVLCPKGEYTIKTPLYVRTDVHTYIVYSENTPYKIRIHLSTEKTVVEWYCTYCVCSFLARGEWGLGFLQRR